MKQMIAYCGLDCEKCEAYIATKNNDNELRVKIAKLWAEMNNAPITAEMINCLGCRVEGVKTPFCESMCEIRQCGINKAVCTCADCQSMNSCKALDMVISNNEEAKNNLCGKK